MEQAKLLHVSRASHTGTCLWPGCSTLIQLLIMGDGDGPSAPVSETYMTLLTFNSDLAQVWPCGHFGSEAAEGRSLSLL